MWNQKLINKSWCALKINYFNQETVDIKSRNCRSASKSDWQPAYLFCCWLELSIASEKKVDLLSFSAIKSSAAD